MLYFKPEFVSETSVIENKFIKCSFYFESYNFNYYYSTISKYKFLDS